MLQLLPANDSDDPATDPFEHLSIRDVPVLNQLSDLHFGTSIRATRDAGLYYLQLSLRLGAFPMAGYCLSWGSLSNMITLPTTDERQPARAHMLALLLQASQPEEALYWQ